MIFKSLIFVCTILYCLPRAARCESDASLELGETNLAGSSLPEFVTLHERYVNNDDIDHVKPVLNNVDVSARDYQKFRIEPRRLPPRRVDTVESNINVNVNHHDSSQQRRNMKRSKKLNRRPSSKQRDDDQRNSINWILDMLQKMPNTNVDYNLAYPQGDMRIQRRKYSNFKILTKTPEDDREALVSIGENDDRCYPIVHKALEYLKSVEINLRSLDRDLRSLVSGSHDMDSYKVTTEFIGSK